MHRSKNFSHFQLPSSPREIHACFIPTRTLLTAMLALSNHKAFYLDYHSSPHIEFTATARYIPASGSSADHHASGNENLHVK
jgi:hypothetical protein